MHRLKGGKAALDINIDVLKCCATNIVLTDRLHELLSKAWDPDIPDQWGISKLCTIWKNKGSPVDPETYRGISIGSTCLKILTSIIINRISPWYETQISRTQFGFRTGKGCNDAIYVCKQLQEIAYKTKQKRYTCFIDLAAAYDHVNRDFLFTSIRNRLAHSQATHTINVLEAMYGSTRAYIASEGPDNMFDTTSGMRQGGIESAPGFNLYFDYVLRVYQDRCVEANLNGLQITYRIPNDATNREQREHAPISGLYDDPREGYADDLAENNWNKERLQKTIQLLHNVFSEFGLQINPEKTKTMIWNWDDEVDGRYPDSIITVNNTKLDNVKIFKYLGVWMTYNDMHIGDQELEHRINTAKASFAQNKSVLVDKNVDMKTRVLLLNGLVRSRLTYGCHVWRPLNREIGKVCSTYNNFLRRMITNGFERIGSQPRQNQLDDSDDPEDAEFDYRYVIPNEQLYEQTGTSDLRSYYEKQQQKWISHTIRASNDDPIKILTFHQVKSTGRGRKVKSIIQRVIDRSNVDINQFCRECFSRRK